MTVTAEQIHRADQLIAHTTEGVAIYCRTNDHLRCSMVCACRCHREIRPAGWTDLPDVQRLQLIEGTL